VVKGGPREGSESPPSLLRDCNAPPSPPRLESSELVRKRFIGDVRLS